jgi:hypothetical protein
VRVDADGAHVAFIGHVTVEELRARLTETDMANGYANRHLFALVRRGRLLASGGNLDDAEVRRLGDAVRSSLKVARSVGILRRTPAAEGRWEHLYGVMDQDAPSGLLGSVIARAEAQVLRVSVAYALLDGAHQIDLPHIEAAWAVWRYCRKSAELIFGDAPPRFVPATTPAQKITAPTPAPTLAFVCNSRFSFMVSTSIDTPRCLLTAQSGYGRVPPPIVRSPRWLVASRAGESKTTTP